MQLRDEDRYRVEWLVNMWWYNLKQNLPDFRRADTALNYTSHPIIKRRESRLRALAHSDDNLLVGD